MFIANNPITQETIECETFKSVYQAALCFLRTFTNYNDEMCYWDISSGFNTKYRLRVDPDGYIYLRRYGICSAYQVIGRTTVR